MITLILIIYLIGAIGAPFMYMWVECKGRGKTVFGGLDYIIMVALSFMSWISWIIGYTIYCDYIGKSYLPKLDISKWIDK